MSSVEDDISADDESSEFMQGITDHVKKIIQETNSAPLGLSDSIRAFVAAVDWRFKH